VSPGIQAAEDLDQRVESLLKQMEDAAHRAADIAKEAEAEPAPPPAVPLEADLASQVDQLLAEAAGGPPAAPESIGSLDDELAKLASDLIEGDLRGDAPPPPTFALPSPAPVHAGPAPNPPVGQPLGQPAVAQAAPAPDAPSPASPPARPGAWRRSAAGAGHGVVLVSIAIKAHAPTLWRYLEPAVYRLAALISAPLRNRPALVRDAVGWVGLGTAFWASCLLVYFLFLFEPAPPHATSAAIGLLDPSGAESSHKAAEAAHEPAKETAKAGGEHEAGGHEGGAKPESKQASPLKRPAKNPLGLTPKKPEKADAGGHGE
jgi:hypothetical protein